MMLRNLKYEGENNETIKLFEILYNTFCYNTVSVIALCILSEEYELAYNIILL